MEKENLFGFSLEDINCFLYIIFMSVVNLCVKYCLFEIYKFGIENVCLGSFSLS